MGTTDTQDRAMLRWLVTRLAPSTRAKIVVASVLDLVVRASSLATALTFGASITLTVALVSTTTVVVVLRRTLGLVLRIEIDRDLHIAITRALLDGEVVRELPVEPHSAVGDGIFHATALAAETLPALAADIVGSMLAVTAVIGAVRPIIAGVVLLAGTVVGVSTLLLRARIGALHERSLLAQEALRDEFATMLHGRLEIVANGVRAHAQASVDLAARRFERESTRSARWIAVLGRAPFAVALALGMVVLVASGAVTAADWRAELRTFAVLAASLPIVLGLVFGAQSLLRAQKKLRPLRLLVHRESPLRDGDRVAESTRPIQFEGVRFGYPGAPPVLLDFTAEWNDRLLLLRGANGSGKTTVLRIIAGLCAPDEGNVLVSGADISSFQGDAWRARIAFLPQQPYLGEPYASVADAFRLVSPEIQLDAMNAELERIGIHEALAARGAPLERPVGQLSVGQRQRVAIARVLARNAELLLLDEPDANLDAEGVDRLVSILEGEVASGKMVAIAAHGPITERLRGTVWDLGASQARPGLCKEG